MLFLELANSLKYALKANRIGIPHRTAAIGWESVTVDVDDVDVRSPKGESLLENLRTFVDERVNCPLDDLLSGHLPPLNAGCPRCIGDNRFHFGIRRRRSVAFGIAIPAPAGFLAEATLFTQSISRQGLAHSRGCQIFVFPTNSPTHIETSQITNCQRPHRHPEFN